MYEIFEKLLKEKGVTTYQVAKATGISTASFTGWKQGKWNFKTDKLQKIADYFGVSVDYLLTGKNEEASDSENEVYYLNNETADIAQKIFENKELKVLFDAAQDAQPEDLGTVYQMLLALKRKERGEDS